MGTGSVKKNGFGKFSISFPSQWIENLSFDRRIIRDVGQINMNVMRHSFRRELRFLPRIPSGAARKCSVFYCSSID